MKKDLNFLGMLFKIIIEIKEETNLDFKPNRLNNDYGLIMEDYGIELNIVFIDNKILVTRSGERELLLSDRDKIKNILNKYFIKEEVLFVFI